MKTVWAILAAILATLTGTAILGDLVSEEIRGRLDHLPHAIIRLAARRLPPDVREDLAQEWTAELHELLRGAEALPITRLYRGIRYAFGLLRAAPSIGRDLSTSTAKPRAAGKASDIPRRPARIAGNVIVVGFVVGIAGVVATGIGIAIVVVGGGGAVGVVNAVIRTLGGVSVVTTALGVYMARRARRRESG
jgi:hypothetical protein